MTTKWFVDLMMRKPKPTNTAPGLIYMLNGATQHSYTDPFDRTSPLIPIGPPWMLIWPFEAEASGLSTVMRDAGTMIMFAGTPYAHLHSCGDPWAGNEYHRGDKAVWTMTYDQRAYPPVTPAVNFAYLGERPMKPVTQLPRHPGRRAFLNDDAS